MEFEREEGLEEEPKDRTKWLWTGVAVSFVVMGVVLWFMGGRFQTDISRVRARHILIGFSDPAERATALELANNLRERIVNGESFSKLAKEYSTDDMSARRGGDLGFQKRGTFVDAFEKYVWSGEVGAVSDVILTSNGFHLIKIERRQVSEIDRVEMERKRRVQGLDAAESTP